MAVGGRSRIGICSRVTAAHTSAAVIHRWKANKAKTKNNGRIQKAALAMLKKA